MSVRKTTAKSRRLNCPKCRVTFSVSAFITSLADGEAYWASRAQEHDCEGHRQEVEKRKVAKINPIKASKGKVKK